MDRAAVAVDTADTDCLAAAVDFLPRLGLWRIRVPFEMDWLGHRPRKIPRKTRRKVDSVVVGCFAVVVDVVVAVQHKDSVVMVVVVVDEFWTLAAVDMDSASQQAVVDFQVVVAAPIVECGDSGADGLRLEQPPPPPPLPLS